MYKAVPFHHCREHSAAGALVTDGLWSRRIIRNCARCCLRRPSEDSELCHFRNPARTVNCGGCRDGSIAETGALAWEDIFRDSQGASQRQTPEKAIKSSGLSLKLAPRKPFGDFSWVPCQRSSCWPTAQSPLHGSSLTPSRPSPTPATPHATAAPRVGPWPASRRPGRRRR